MIPYYQDDAVTIYHGDCRDVTEWLQADVLITDPPYGMSYVSNFSKYGSTPPIAADGSTEIRDRVLCMWGERPALVFGTWRVERPAATRHLLVWDKGDSPGMGDLSIPWGHGHEEIYLLGSGAFTGPRRTNVLRHRTLSAGAHDRPDHPTPKPTGLMRDLIACTSGVIADPFAGSGSTLRAAKDLGRKAIGIEIEERYCELAARRCAQEVLDLGDAA